MTSAGGRQTQPNKPNQPVAGSFAGKQATILLEKGNPGLRRATPDSEALASSDDEGDHGMSSSIMSNPISSKATRRPSGTSWLSEIPSQRRKPSITFGGPSSPAESHQTASPADQGTWPSAVSPGGLGSGRPPAPTSSFPWGSGIWNETKDASAGNRGTMGEQAIPFTIPLHPTPKTYRSQSYSVGQLDQDPQSSSVPAAVGTRSYGRGRAPGPYTNLQHRPSRPSILGDLGHDSGVLGRVREDEIDEEEQSGQDTGLQSQDRPQQDLRQPRMDHLPKGNVGTYHSENAFRDRTLSSTSTSSPFGENNPNYLRSSRFYGIGVHETDEVVDDPEESGDLYSGATQTSYARRYSDQQPNAEQPSRYSSLESRNLENARKAQWQTSLGFGSIPELPQSRRHSFADVPTRQGSIDNSSSNQQPLLGLGSSLAMHDQQETPGYYAEDVLNSSRGENQAYFPGEVFRRDGTSLRSDPMYASLQNYQTPAPMARGQHPQHPQHAQHAPARRDQPLFVVTFKAQRSDVFYIQEDTGLEVKVGDMVIVEADRGTDLGTVAAANVSWDKARNIKASLAEEHYKWLVMFSRQGQASGAASVNTNKMAALLGAPGSAVGGMGPPGTHGLQEPQSGELKPKLIKRLAQPHEIQTLREKEGNEAKAKRVCQQKVVEHRLNMEILDAEFQMDWKKLTFYYFADAYINFNSLVTDLFKIYKTRIWMSAINPDSFITPTSALTQPSPTGLGPGAIGMGRENIPNRRRQNGPPSQAVTANYLNELNDQARTGIPGHNPGLRGVQSNAYPSVAMMPPDMRSPNYSQTMAHPADPFNSYLSNPYAAFDPMLNYTVPTVSNDQSGRSGRSPVNEWSSVFQGLSLGS